MIYYALFPKMFNKNGNETFEMKKNKGGERKKKIMLCRYFRKLKIHKTNV